jgi:AraC-like DNA-binding protein
MVVKMLDSKSSLSDENTYTYDRLIVSLEAGLGSLQILLAVCDNSDLRNLIIELYEKELQIQSYRLMLNQDEPSLLQALIDGQVFTNGKSTNKVIATVTGAEIFGSSRERSTLDKFLGYLQWTRESLRKYPMPIVLWLPSQLLHEIAKHAPDFWSWRGGVFPFKIRVVEPSTLDSYSAMVSDYEWWSTNPFTNQETNFVLSLQQLESSLAEALTAWGEDSPNIEPIYAQLGRAYAKRVANRETSDLIQEIALAETYLNKAIFLQKSYNRKYDLAYSLSILGYIYSLLGKWNDAESVYKESLYLNEELGDSEGIETSRRLLEDIKRYQGRWNIVSGYLEIPVLPDCFISKLNLSLFSKIIRQTLPNKPPTLVGQVSDSSLFLADYQKYDDAQIKEHSNPFHTLEVIGANSITPHKRRMGDYRNENPLKGGEICFCPARDVYSLTWEQNVDFTLIAIDPEIVKEISEMKFGSSQLELIPKIFVDNIHPIKEIVNVIKQEIAFGYPNDDLFLESMRTALVIAIINKFAIFKKPITTVNIDNLSNKKVKLIQDYIQEHLAENIPLEDLANITGISKYHFCRSFKQSTGITITDYIIGERVKLAQKLLINSPLNIAEIAYACGFHDASHLNRYFKLLMQMTPTAFREKFSNRNRKT